MLKRLKDVAISALFGAFLFGFGIAVWSASSCDPREKTEQAATKKKSHNETCDAFKISPYKGIGVFLGNNATEISAAVTAFATIFIAWFTLTLRNSTNNLWLASEKQFAAVNRPKIRMKHVQIAYGFGDDPA